MKTTRSIDEITTEVKIGCTDAMGGVHKVYIPLTEEAKAELLATILASMPEKKEGELRQIPCPDGRVGCLVMHMGSDKIKSERDHGWNAHKQAVEQAIKKIFEGGE